MGRPYSVAIILNELSALSRATLLGTDLDATVLAKARAGVYAENEIRSLPPELVEKYFREDRGYYHLSDYILKAVTFKKHNLLVDRFEHDFDLIICRNVVIYFTEEAKTSYTRNFIVLYVRRIFLGGRHGAVTQLQSLGF